MNLYQMEICVNAADSVNDKSKSAYPVKNTCLLDYASLTLLKHLTFRVLKLLWQSLVTC